MLRGAIGAKFVQIFYLSVCLSVSLSLSLSFSLFLSLSIYLSIYLLGGGEVILFNFHNTFTRFTRGFCLYSLSLSFCLSIYLSFPRTVYLSVILLSRVFRGLGPGQRPKQIYFCSFMGVEYSFSLSYPTMYCCIFLLLFEGRV